MFGIPATRARSVDDLSAYEIAVGGVVLEERQQAAEAHALERERRAQNANPGPIAPAQDLPEWTGIGKVPKRADA